VKNSDLVLWGTLRHSGVKLPLNLGDWVQYWMFMDGVYERELVDFLCPVVKGKVFFDVGANVGSYTLSLARNAGKVYAFEASLGNFRTLTKFVECAGFSNVEAVNRAVSDREGGEIRLFSSPDTGGNHSQFYDFGKGFETATTVSLDQFVEEERIERVDVIKMDIEGGEYRAFGGAQRILRRDHPLLLVEFNARTAEQAHWKLASLHDLLLAYDYKSYELKCGKLTAFDGEGLADSHFYSNLVFIHEPSGQPHEKEMTER